MEGNNVFFGRIYSALPLPHFLLILELVSNLQVIISGPERSFVAGNFSLLTSCRSFGIGKTCKLLVFNTVCLYFCIWWLKDTFRMFPEGTVYVFMSLTQGFLKEVKQVLAKCWALSTPGSYNQHSQIKGLLKSHQEAVCSTLTGRMFLNLLLVQ